MISEQQSHKFCKDDISKIENYDKAIADTTQIWDLHHRLELTLDGEFAHTAKELQRLNMYYHRPYFELIFLMHSEHVQLHKKGKALSDWTKRRMSEAKKCMSAETKRRMSEAAKARWARRKSISN